MGYGVEIEETGNEVYPRKSEFSTKIPVDMRLPARFSAVPATSRLIAFAFKEMPDEFSRKLPGIA